MPRYTNHISSSKTETVHHISIRLSHDIYYPPTTTTSNHIKASRGQRAINNCVYGLMLLLYHSHPRQRRNRDGRPMYICGCMLTTTMTTYIINSVSHLQRIAVVKSLTPNDVKFGKYPSTRARLPTEYGVCMSCMRCMQCSYVCSIDRPKNLPRCACGCIRT